MRPPPIISHSENEDASGSCSYGCAVLFILAAIVWPLLHVLGGTYEPEILFITFVVGGPSFIVAHILALISIFSKPPGTGTSRGGRALKGLWLVFGIFLIVSIFSLIFDKATGRDLERQSEQMLQNMEEVAKPAP